MTCTCRNSDPNSSLPPGADGCVVSSEAATRELALQAEALQRLLTTPALLSTKALSLLTLSSFSERLVKGLAPGDVSTDVVPTTSDQAGEYVDAITNKKENPNGYL